MEQSTTPQTQGSRTSKPIVVGLYGISGSGKTFLLYQLKKELEEEHFAFYDGSKMIAAVTPGGLNAFIKLEEKDKKHWREVAIDEIAKECAATKKVGVVAGHLMLWSEKEQSSTPVYTKKDLETFTHILYLNIDPEIVSQRCRDDTEKKRDPISTANLRKWQQAEKSQLVYLGLAHGILFHQIPDSPKLVDKVSTLLRDFRQHDKDFNLDCAEKELDGAAKAYLKPRKTMLVLDADKTLAAEDTGSLFVGKSTMLKDLFGGPLGYSYAAFRQATLWYEEEGDDERFDAECQRVAKLVDMHPDFVSLLQLVAESEDVGAVVVTSGIRRVWEKVLQREGLDKSVKVIGGGRIADGYVVTPEVKAVLVAHLQETHKMHVWAFGDSRLDLPMMAKANQAVVVVGEKHTRSRTMDNALLNAIENQGLRARQALLPSTAPPRLDTNKLPLIQLTGPEFVDSLLGRSDRNFPLKIHHATDRAAAKLLMTPTRDAAVAGPDLRKAHRHVGRYLATEFLSDIICLEEYDMQSVQRKPTKGHRLLHEKKTLIVPLMRGGEPMAFGINEAFPLAMFKHANDPEDIKLEHVQGLFTIVLVDSVINSGKSIVDFVQHIRSLHATIRIVVVAGVVQAQAIKGSSLSQAFARYGNVSLVALRLSENKFTGKGGTDTGNRLFNTTHLD